MVEINFMEVYCQSSKNIFEATIFLCKKYFKIKEKWAIFIRAHFIWAVWHSWEGGTSWGRCPRTRLGGGSTNFAVFQKTKNA